MYRHTIISFLIINVLNILRRLLRINKTIAVYTNIISIGLYIFTIRVFNTISKGKTFFNFPIETKVYIIRRKRGL